MRGLLVTSLKEWWKRKGKRKKTYQFLGDIKTDRKLREKVRIIEGGRAKTEEKNKFMNLTVTLCLYSK